MLTLMHPISLPLSEQAADLSGEEDETVENVEEFFDEEDAEDAEPPISEE